MRTIEQYIEGDGRLKDVLRAAARQLDFSESEFLCFCDATMSTAFEPWSVESGFGLDVADSEPDGLAEKWSVELKALSEKLDSLTPIQKCAMLAAGDGFFHRE
jgi:hypothetical protein